MDTDRLGRDDAFKKAFLHALLVKLPSWTQYVSDRDHPDAPAVLVPAYDAALQPLVIDIESDTVKLHPFCKFGLDYISTATQTDLAQRPDLVFARVLSDLAEFAAGRTFVSIRRNRWLFMKAGWNIRFASLSELDEARRTGATIVVWDGKRM
jgi:hypothetical protein